MPDDLCRLVWTFLHVLLILPGKPRIPLTSESPWRQPYVSSIVLDELHGLGRDLGAPQGSVTGTGMSSERSQRRGPNGPCASEFL